MRSFCQRQKAGGRRGSSIGHRTYLGIYLVLRAAGQWGLELDLASCDLGQVWKAAVSPRARLSMGESRGGDVPCKHGHCSSSGLTLGSSAPTKSWDNKSKVA